MLYPVGSACTCNYFNIHRTFRWSGGSATASPASTSCANPTWTSSSRRHVWSSSRWGWHTGEKKKEQNYAESGSNLGVVRKGSWKLDRWEKEQQSDWVGHQNPVYVRILGMPKPVLCLIMQCKSNTAKRLLFDWQCQSQLQRKWKLSSQNLPYYQDCCLCGVGLDFVWLTNECKVAWQDLG